MGRTRTHTWKSLAAWSPRLFVVAGTLSLVAAVNYAVTFLVDGIAFNEWIGLTVLLARLASLLAVAGLSAGIAIRRPRLGTLGRVVVTLAFAFATVLLAVATMSALGYEPPLAAVFGLGTVALSLLAYSLFGVLVLRSGAHPAPVGWLLLVATAGLLFGLFGRVALPLGLVGTAAELVLAATHVGIGYTLRTRTVPSRSTEPAPESAPK